MEVIGIAILSTIVAIILARIVWTQRDTIMMLRRDLDYINKRHLVLSGWDIARGNFYYFSLDAGDHWWQYLHNADGSLAIIPADKEAKAEMEHREGIKLLIEHALKNGPIGSQPITEKDITTLRKAGFSVSQETI